MSKHRNSAAPEYSNGEMPMPVTREVRYQMNNCGATNKLKFSFGSLALFLFCGVSEVLEVFFMVLGHSKFTPDDLARSIASVYQESDTFNFGLSFSMSDPALLEW